MKVAVGMSGGVDSSVCAWLLKERGYEVIGATIRMWLPEGREEAEGVEDARRVARYLGIEHHVLDFRKEFQERIVNEFADEYLKGHTPNPCVNCNRFIKWGLFLSGCADLGANRAATGHYARVVLLGNGRYSVSCSKSDRKDQTYVLYRLTQEGLSRTLMPLGEYEKEKVREIAERRGIPVAHKKDSQDICFIPDGDYAGFIRRWRGSLGKPGFFRDTAGNILGEHDGTARFTIGQRKGLGIALGHPVYVCGIDALSGDVVLSDNSELHTLSLLAGDLSYMGEERFDEDFTYMAKIRYSQGSAPCRVSYEGGDAGDDGNGKIRVRFEKPVRAATPGQAVVLYRDGWVAGGGVIIRGCG